MYPIIHQLDDVDPDIRRQAILELRRTEIAAQRHDVVSALIAALDDPHLAVREAAEDTLIALGDRDVIEALLPCLSGSSPTMLNAAIEILRKIGLRAMDLILPLLENRDHDIRKFACDIVGSLKYADALYDLIDLLTDPHINVAIAAGEALGNIGSAEAVPMLIRSLHHPDTWMQCIAAEALGKIGDKRALEPFLMMSVSEDPIVLYAVIKALGNFDDPRVLPYIIDLLHSHPMFASSAAQAIDHLAKRQGEHVYQTLKASDVKDVFLRLLANENIDVLRSAISLAGHLQLEAAVPPLRRLLEHHDVSVIVKATVALSRIGDAGMRELHLMLERLLPSFQRDVAEYDEQFASARLPMIRVIGEKGSIRSLPLLMQALDESVADEIRVEAAFALAKILSGVPNLAQAMDAQTEDGRVCAAALQRLMAGVEDSSDAFRLSVAEALGETGAAAAYAPLLRLLQDAAPSVSEAASAALPKLRGLSAHEKIEPVRAILMNSPRADDEIRASALRTIYRIAGEQETAFLLAYLTDASPLVRTAALEALRTASPENRRDADIPDLIAPLLRDDNMPVRAAAIHALTAWGMHHLPADTRAFSAETAAALTSLLLPQLNDPHPRVQYVACQQVATLIPHLPDPRAVGDAVVTRLTRLLGDDDPMVIIAAIEALTALRNDVDSTQNALPALRTLLNQTTDAEVASSLQQALALFEL